MKIIEKNQKDITEFELGIFEQDGYVCVDTETTGLDYKLDALCTIQLYSSNCAILIKYSNQINYENLTKLFMSKTILKIFHNAVFDVSFIMKRFNLNDFGRLVCTKISSKIINGLEHNNSLKPLLKEYLNVEIDKKQQLSNWSKEELLPEQKEYAMNDVRYLYLLWTKMKIQLEEKQLLNIAYECFGFVSKYKRLTDLGIDNIFKY